MKNGPAPPVPLAHLAHSVQPLIIAAVCGILFGIARRKEKNTENHPDEGNL